MKNLDQLLATLSPERHALVTHLYAEKRSQREQIANITRKPAATDSPLSFAQERLWFLAQLDPQGTSYNEHTAFLLQGPLDLNLFTTCFNAIIQRHEILRTVFTRTQQQLLPELTITLPLIDISEMETDERHRTIAQLDQASSTQPFDLETGPLLRVQLVKLGTDKHLALVTLHHIISDGWSIGLLTREIITLYEAYRSGQTAALPVLPIQYRDFAYWQRTSFQQELLEQHLSYWKQQLAEPLPFTELPADRVLPALPSYQGAVETRELSTTLIALLHTLCQRLGMSPFGLFLAAFALLLGRYTRQEDIILGSPIAGRTRRETEHLIGCFINTLALRIDLSGNPVFTTLLERVKKTIVDAYTHQEAPFEKIVQEVQPERSVHRTPLFNVLFNFNNTPQTPLNLPDIQVTRLELTAPSAKFPLTIYLNTVAQRLQIRVVYQAERFTQRLILTLLDHYQSLLEQIVTAPDQPISSYSLITPATQSLLANLASILPEPHYPPVPYLIAEQVTQHPQAIALRQGSKEWSYATLMERATLLSQALLAHGIQSGDVVAVQGTRSFGLVASMLGVWLSGAVLLTIDSILPTMRQRMLLQEAKACTLLLVGHADDQVGMMDKGQGQTHIQHYFMVAESTGQLITDQPAADNGSHTLPVLSPADPAYIFFTSGTMGKPKGVLGNHRGLSHFLHWQRQTFQVTVTDRCAQLTGLSFDVVLRDIFLALTSGATLILPPESENLSARTILPWLEREQITIVHTTPSIVQAWIKRAESWHNNSLRLLFLAGEPLTRALVQQLCPLIPSTGEIVNLYGPTETSLAKCYHRIPLDKDPEQPTIPIGRPLPETQIFIMSPQQRLCGIGEIGEIVIRTPFRSSGYINADDEQQRRFITNPWRDDEHDLLYLTGDYGRYTPPGTLEILGRLDTQIKIRGIRVEPNEVASQLVQHHAISACFVNMQCDEQGQAHLVAYIVLTAQAQVTTVELRNYLNAYLPQAMIPSAFIFLDAIPLTANGKVDQQALPPFKGNHPSSNTVLSQPATTTEEDLLAIWKRILNVEQIGVHDNFFDMGGHSLLAMDIVASLQEYLHRHIPLRTIFVHPTIAGLARVCDQISSDEHVPFSSLPTITPQPEKQNEPFPLTAIQQAYWVGRSTSFELGNIATHNYSEFEFPRLDLSRFQHALQSVIQRHSMLRAVISEDGLQQILPEMPPYTIPFHDLSQADESAITQHLTTIRQQLSHYVFPLGQWPFFEVQISRVSNTRFIVHISIDALICDAWSRHILGRELLLFYDDLALQLPEPTLSFRDYVLAEQALRTTAQYQQARDYWMGRLATIPPAPELPLVISPQAVTKPHFVRHSGKLAPDEWQKLKAKARAAGLTPSALICAAYADILALWSRNSEFTINLTLFQRLPLHKEVNTIIGDFTSLTLLSIGNTAGTFLERALNVHARLLEDLDHRYFSGIEVLRELNRQRGGMIGALMPIVLTSTLTDSDQAQEEALDMWYSGSSYGISQTPQVFIDHAVSEQRGALVFRWDTVQEIFPAGMIEEMFEAYQRLLQGLAQHESLWHLPSRGHLLPPHDLALRASINATQTPLPQDHLLHSGFLEQARLHPDALAVLTPSCQFSYHELEQRSAWLAHRLLSLGARPNQLIAVCMPKGWQQVVAVLAILRAGAAYLPLDPSLPTARRTFLLEQGQVHLICTTPALTTQLSWPQHTQLLSLSREPFPASSPPPLPTVQQQSDLAYVIYTSGSTGLPKGVMIDHRGALNTIADLNARFSVGPTDRVLALSALHFDLSVYDIFGLLAAGGTIVLPEADSERDPAHWLSLLQDQQVTLWNSVPALLEMLLDSVAGLEELPELGLRLVLLSGDWIGLGLPERLWRLCKSARLMSLGGATEASIWSIYFPVEQVDPQWKSIPYGKPLRNQSWHVLNARLEPCPQWVPGDLYIGGIGLAQGYWRDEERTAASFLLHPHSGERLYRTGDLGRYLPDGTIEFLGREDTQIKLQGHRIELGEIEATLVGHEQVKEAVVLVRGQSAGPRSLVAYVVPKPQAAPPALPSRNGPLLDIQARAAFKTRHINIRAINDPASSISLPVLPPSNEDGQSYLMRLSYQQFAQEMIPLEAMSAFLSCLRQMLVDNKPKYRYASAGGLYPVQTYLFIKSNRIEGLDGGIYYYHPLYHQLIQLTRTGVINETVHWPANRPAFLSSAFSLFLIAKMEAITPLYASAARDFCLLEAGLMTQLMETSALHAGLGLCQIGTLDFERIREHFQLDEDHQLLYSLVGGLLPPPSSGTSQEVQPVPISTACSDDTPAQLTGTINQSQLAETLQTFLKEQLPYYMVPTQIVFLDTLPLNSNGKVDRKALLEIELAASPNDEYVAPRTALEVTIANILQEVLEIESISTRTNFFDLGANSLSMIRAHSQLQRALQHTIPIVDIFRYTSIEALAQHLREEEAQTQLLSSRERVDKRASSRRRRGQMHTEAE